MAIARDTFTGEATNTSFPATRSHTCTGSDLVLLVAGISDANLPTGITYNGVAMTRLVDFLDASSQNTSIWGLLNPATGANTIEVSGSMAYFSWFSCSYTGVKQTGLPDNTSEGAVSGSTSHTQNITTVANNCALFMLSYGNAGGIAAGTGSTLIAKNTTFNDANIAESNPLDTGTAGAKSMTMTWSSNTSNGGAVMVSLAPAVAAGSTTPIPRLLTLGVG